jgi:hypothetical protein
LSQFANISPAYLRSLAAMLEQQRQWGIVISSLPQTFRERTIE